MAAAALKLVVGLGNPGSEHRDNRHNAGAAFVDRLCREHGGALRRERRCHGATAGARIGDVPVRLLVPATFMNDSGRAVAAALGYYRIDPSDMLVAHDEIDFDAGVVRLRCGGGHGGHNGLRDIIGALGGKRDFRRLRIGVGHPGEKSKVTGHVLSDPAPGEARAIGDALDRAVAVMPLAARGDWEAAMRRLHAAGGPP